MRGLSRRPAVCERHAAVRLDLRPRKHHETVALGGLQLTEQHSVALERRPLLRIGRSDLQRCKRLVRTLPERAVLIDEPRLGRPLQCNVCRNPYGFDFHPQRSPLSGGLVGRTGTHGGRSPLPARLFLLYPDAPIRSGPDRTRRRTGHLARLRRAGTPARHDRRNGRFHALRSGTRSPHPAFGICFDMGRTRHAGRRISLAGQDTALCRLASLQRQHRPVQRQGQRRPQPDSAGKGHPQMGAGGGSGQGGDRNGTLRTDNGKGYRDNGTSGTECPHGGIPRRSRRHRSF